MGQAARGSPERLFSLDAHLPGDRRQALAQGLDLPDRAVGTVLLADVSGFTPLMEHLANTLGPQQGAERLTHLLNALFTPLVSQVHRTGGSIVAFGGDALACWFPGDSALRAAACALALQQQVTASAADEVALAMHVGIASGEVRRFVVGRPPRGLLDVLAGAAVERMAAAQARAQAGHVVVDAATAAALPPESRLPLEEGWARLTGLPIPLPAPPGEPPAPALPTAQVRRWLAQPLYRRLRAGRGGFAAELRLVTSVFIHFTGLDYEQDAEAGSKLQLYVLLAQDWLALYEGHLALVANDEKGSFLHVLFGAPLAHEDDPLRAVGFALEMQEAARALPFIHEQRCGISVGRAYAGILGSPERCTYTVLGDEVNVSARLMQAARAGQVLVTRPVQRAVAGHYACRDLGTIIVKGREEPVVLFEAQASARQRPVEGDLERLVGRQEEERHIGQVLSALPAGRGQVLLLLGEAGIGKSALVRHLTRLAGERGWPVYAGTCLSYGQHVPYLPWRLVLEQAGALPVGLGPAERAARLEQAVAALADPAGRPGYWRARFPLLAEAMGLEVPDTPLTRSLEGELRRDNTFQLIEALVRSLAPGRPAVVVIEDAYWADELSLALAVHIGRGLPEVPLLLVLVQRHLAQMSPAVVDALQTLPWQSTIQLQPLARPFALDLARQRLRSSSVPAALDVLLQEKAQGNPFFIEELLRALEEAGCLRLQDGAVALTGAWDTLDLPDTIEGVVQARLDRLPEEERLTLKVAAVIGRTFQRALLQEVHPAGSAEAVLSRQLARLGAAAFVQLEEAGPAWRYAFQHPILHEVAYGTLLFAQRRQLHGAIGAVLERWHAGDLPRVLDLLAYHYARSEEREKAVHYLHRAADKARREYANEVALRYYSQALERLLPQEVALRYELLAGRERIHNLMGERDAQERDLQEMGRLAREAGDERRQGETLNRKARQAVDMGEFERARRFARLAWRRGGRCADRAGLAEAGKILGIVHGARGEYEDAERSFLQAWEIYRDLGDHLGEASCLGNLGLVHFYRGDAEQARGYHSRAMELARAAASRWHEAQALINLGSAEFYMGAYERALACYQQALETAREIGSAANEEVALDNIGALEIVLGDLAQAAEHHQQALRLARRLQDPEGEASILANLGLLAAYQGDLALAGTWLRQALAQYQEMGHRRGEAAAGHCLGVAAYWGGDVSTANAALQQVLAIRQEIGESGNALVTQAWLAMAQAAAGQAQAARTHIEAVLAQLQAEGYSGDYPEQEVWWAACCVWRACGEMARARACLEQAHQLVEERAGRIENPDLRRSFLEQVPVNREVEQEWRGLSTRDTPAAGG